MRKSAKKNEKSHPCYKNQSCINVFFFNVNTKLLSYFKTKERHVYIFIYILLNGHEPWFYHSTVYNLRQTFKSPITVHSAKEFDLYPLSVCHPPPDWGRGKSLHLAGPDTVLKGLLWLSQSATAISSFLLWRLSSRSLTMNARNAVILTVVEGALPPLVSKF